MRATVLTPSRYFLVVFFVCFTGRLSCEYSTDPPMDRCQHPDFYHTIEHQGLCYAVVRWITNRGHAKNYCTDEGAVLATITSAQISGDHAAAFIAFLFEKLFTHCGWIGLSDLEKRGVWKWEDGTEGKKDREVKNVQILGGIFNLVKDALGYTKRCMEICRINTQPFWEHVEANCDDQMPFICQYEPSRLPESTTGLRRGEITQSRSNVTESQTASGNHKSSDLTSTGGITSTGSPVVTGNHTSTDLTPAHGVALTAPPKSADSQKTTAYTPKVVRKPKAGGPRRPRQTSRTQQRVMKLSAKSTIPTGTPLWGKTAYSTHMCVRLCLNDRQCDMLSFSSKLQQCLGFGTESLTLTLEPYAQWEVWESVYH